MADKRISEFSEITSVGDDDVLLVGSTNATNKVKAKNLLNLSKMTGTLGINHGGTGASDEQAMHTAVFNNTRTSGWSAYPTAAGIYRTTGTLWTGMPTESWVSSYGVLVIFGCGGYYMHLYADANKNLFYGETASMTAPTTWYRTVRGVKGNAETAYRSGDVNLTPANIGAATAADLSALRAEVAQWKSYTQALRAAMDEYIDNLSIEAPGEIETP